MLMLFLCNPNSCAIEHGYLWAAGSLLFHALQAVVGGVHCDGLHAPSGGQEGAQCRKDVDGTHVVPVQVHGRQAARLCPVGDALLKVQGSKKRISRKRYLRDVPGTSSSMHDTDTPSAQLQLLREDFKHAQTHVKLAERHKKLRVLRRVWGPGRHTWGFAANAPTPH